MESRRRTASFRLWALLLAGAFALISNYCFTGEWVSRSQAVHGSGWDARQSVGSVCLVAAVVLAAIGFGRRQRPIRAVSENGFNSGSANSVLQWWHFAPSACFYAAASVRYLYWAESGTVHLLWWASIISFVLPLVRRGERESWLELTLWEYVLVASLTVAAFFLRYTDLLDLPYQIDNDVAIMGQYSQQMLQAGNARWIGMAPTDHQFSEHQFLVTSMRLFGPGQYGLVMLNVLAGTATVPLLFLTGRSLFNRWVGLIAAAFFCADYVNIHFSRIVFGPIAIFFLALSGVFFARGIRRASPLAFGLAGMAVGGCLLDYYSGRVAPVIYFGLFLAWFFQRKKYPGVSLYFWLVALVGGLVVFGPNLAYSFRFGSAFSGRTNQVVIWSEAGWEHVTGQVGAGATVFKVLLEQTRHALLAPFYYPDQSTICYLREPMLGLFAGICFVFGLGWCFTRCRELAALFLLLSIGLTFVFGGILTTNPPFWPHLNIASPALAMIAAVGLQAFARRWLVFSFRWIRFAVSVVTVLLILGSGLQNWNTYTAFERNYIGRDPLAARHVRELPKEFHVLLVSSVVRWSGPLFQFLNPSRNGQNVLDEVLPESLPAIVQPTAVYVFAGPNRQKWLDFLATKYPDATKEVFRDAWQEEAFTVFRIYPAGYLPANRALEKPTREIQATLGGKLLIALALAGVLVGWVIYRRESKLAAERDTTVRT